MKKSIKISLILLISALSLCGCFNSRQLSERALVQAIGIDFEDGKYKLTFQIFSPAGKGGEAVTASSDNAVILKSGGDTISEAFQNATMLQGKELFIGHSRILILGEGTAKNGVDLPLKFFAANASARQNINLAVAKGKAEDLLSVKINQGILPAATIENILENGKENGLISNIKLYQLLASLKNKHECAVLPMLAVKEQKSNKEESSKEEIKSISSVEAVGMAILKDAKLIDVLQNDEAQGLLWIRNAIKQTTIVVETDDYDMCALNIYDAKSKITPSYSQNGELNFILDINCQATMSEKSHKQSTVAITETATEKLEKACGDFIRNECMAAFKKAVIKDKSDIFNFGNIVRKDNAELFKVMREDWLKTISDVKLSVNTEVKINRVGLILE